MPNKDDLVARLRSHWRPTHGNEPLWIGCGDGWLDLIEAAHAQIVAICPSYHLTEVFQKYGELVIRVDAIPASVAVTVDACLLLARMCSREQCETCGDAGTLSRDPSGWLAVVCPDHAAQGAYVPMG